MLAFMVNFLSKLKHVLVAIYGVICRALCCRRRLKRSNSGMLLPISVTTQYSNSGEAQRDMNTVSNSASNVAKRNDSNYWQNKVQQTKTTAVVHHHEPDDEEEPDYFRDMTPAFKKQKKVMVGTPDSREDVPVSNRLGVDLRATITTTSELGLIDESNVYNGSWEEEAVGGDILDVEATLRDARQAERERRLAEHKRIKMEKELKKMKSQRSNFIATKIS